MSRYRKTMRQAIEEGLSNMQIAILKKEYAPFKGKTISAARAKQLMNILDKFKEDDLQKLGKENIPFVSSGSRSKLAVRNMKFKVTSINPFKEEVTQEDFDLEEGKMKTIATMFDAGKSAEEIAKAMKLSVDTVKTILGEVKEENLEEAPDPITYGPDKVAKAMAIAVKSDGQYSKAVREIEKIGKDLSKVSTIARALKTANEEFKVRFTDPANKKKFHITYRSKGEAEAKMAQLKKDGVKQIEIVSEDLDAQPQDRDVKKIKGTQPKKYYKKMSKDDKEKRAKHFTTRDTSKNDNRPAPGDKGAKTKPSIHTKKFKQMYGEELLDEKIKGLENKAKKSGMPYGILKKVYDRGMAAWRGGHRPGATQQQWAFARVNSFVTKSSGTWGGADKDLAKKVRASK